MSQIAKVRGQGKKMGLLERRVREQLKLYPYIGRYKEHFAANQSRKVEGQSRRLQCWWNEIGAGFRRGLICGILKSEGVSKAG